MGAQQDFGRAKRTCSQDYHFGSHEHGGGIEPLAARVKHLVMHAPQVAVALHMTHADLSVYLSAVVPCIRQVVHQGSVLGREVTAGAAITAQFTCLLWHAYVVHAVLEGNVDGRS